YSHLIRFPENAHSVDPFWFRAGRIDFRLRGSGLSDSSVNLLKRLLYAGDVDLMLFADVEPALRAIPDPQERQRFVKAVSRKKSVLARLKIDKDADVEALAEYWGDDGRQKDLVPLLNSLRYNAERGIEEDARINIMCLLPPFARDRLYGHPFANSISESKKEDCFWSALNFFNAVPDY